MGRTSFLNLNHSQGLFFPGKTLPGNRKHQLNAVFLVDAGGAGVVVDRRDIGLGIEFPNPIDHALAADMVR